MFKHNSWVRRILGKTTPLTLIFLLIEFIDELHWGITGAALPEIRGDLGLTYAQVGLFFSVPGIVSTILEPPIFLLADSRLRKSLILGGGFLFIGSTLLMGAAPIFPFLLLGYTAFFPASGAFVGLSQATLMDRNPGREAQMMARWTAAGSLANLVGPIILSASLTLGLGWRGLYYGMAIITILPLLALTKQSIRHGTPSLAAQGKVSLVENALAAVKNRKLLRWIGLLEASDLLLDIFTGYLALYFTDVVGLQTSQAALVLGALMLVSLGADVALIAVLEKVPGRALVRVGAVLAAVFYSAFLLAPWLWAKVILVFLVRICTTGWYQVLAGEAYAAGNGRSGSVAAAGSVGGIFLSLFAGLLGWTAAQAGLSAAMWLLLIGPISLALFVPRADVQHA